MKMLSIHRPRLSIEIAMSSEQFFAEMKGACGWLRIWQELAALVIHAGKERVRKLMQSNGLQARGKRKFNATTQLISHSHGPAMLIDLSHQKAVAQGGASSLRARRSLESFP